MDLLIKFIPYTFCLFLTGLLIYFDYLFIQHLRISDNFIKVVCGIAWFVTEISILLLIILLSVFISEKLHINFKYTKIKIDTDLDEEIIELKKNIV